MIEKAPIDTNSKITKKSNFAIQELDDRLILVPVKEDIAEMDYLYQLNETAAFIWDCFDGKRSIEEISQELTHAFKISMEEARKEVKKVLDELDAFVERIE